MRPGSPDTTVSPPFLRAGLERHVWPSDNGKGIVTNSRCLTNEYNRNKSGLWLILKIIRHILFPHVPELGPLLAA